VAAQPKPPLACGKTVAEALAQARVALAQPDAGSERTALACLIAAVGELDDRKQEKIRHVLEPDHRDEAP